MLLFKVVVYQNYYFEIHEVEIMHEHIVPLYLYVEGLETETKDEWTDGV